MCAGIPKGIVSSVPVVFLPAHAPGQVTEETVMNKLIAAAALVAAFSAGILLEQNIVSNRSASHIKRGWDRDQTGQLAPVARPVSLGVPRDRAHPCEIKAASFCSRLVGPNTRNHCKYYETWSCLSARYRGEDSAKVPGWNVRLPCFRGLRSHDCRDPAN